MILTPTEIHRPIVIAHRGSIYKIPENTKQALRKPLEKGFSIETDLQRTKDKKLVLYHDHFVPGPDDENLNGGGFYLPERKPVTKCTLDELQNAKFNQAKLETHLSKQAGEDICLELEDKPQIATPDDLLPIPEGTKAYIEIIRRNHILSHDYTMEDMLVDWVNINNLKEKVVIISFNFHSLFRVRYLDPDIEIGVDVKGPLTNLVLLAKALSAVLNIHSWDIPLSQATPRLINTLNQFAHADVMPCVFNEDKKSELEKISRLLGSNIKGIFTNQAEEVRAMIERKIKK